MERIFIEIINNALSVTFLILAVMVVRFVIKMPRWIMCLLWMIVAVKLLLPVSFESAVSLNPINRPVTMNSVSMNNRQLNQLSENNVGDTTQTNERYKIHENKDDESNVTKSSKVIDSDISKKETINEVNVLQIAGMYIWIIGMIVMLCYASITFCLLKRKVRLAVRRRKNIYVCDDIADPFILGIIRPRIYLPSDLSKVEEECILKHEKMHIARKDYIWKPLGFLLLIVYWFQPLCWVAYILLCKDIEYACDEKSIAGENDEFRTNYCETLLGYSSTRGIINACPVAFGEISVKERIKNVLQYKNPSFWGMVISVVACLVVTTCFATNQRQSTLEERYTYLDISGCNGITGYCITEPGGTPKKFVIEPTDSHFDELLNLLQTTEFKDRIISVFPWQTHTNQGQTGDYSFDLYLDFGEIQLEDGQTISGALLYIKNFYGDLSIESLGESSLCSVNNQKKWSRNIMDIIENCIEENVDAEEMTLDSFTQQEIFDKMVNAVEYYSYAKGKMVYAIPNVWNVEFETDLETGTAFEKTVGEGLLSTVTAKNGVITIVTNGVTHTSYSARTKSDPTQRAHMGKRLDGENEYFMRADPTNTQTARNCLLPQEITFNFLGDRDCWEVKEITTYLDRTVWYIEGRLGVVPNDKLGADDFVMYVDCATGILLKYEVLDKQGNVKHYAYMEELEIR